MVASRELDYSFTQIRLEAIDCMKVYYLILAFGTVAGGGFWWYLIILLKRTGFGRVATSIGHDVVWITYVASFVACAMPGVALLMKRPGKWFPILLLVVAGIGSAIFVALNVSGKVGQYIKP